MQRWLLMILVTWPLLMPPGFCICRLEAFMPRPADRLTVAEVQEKAPTPGCRCCRRAGEPRTPAGKASACRADSCPSVPSPGEPHAPNCLASTTWELLRAGVYSPSGFDVCDFLSLDLSVVESYLTGVELLSIVRITSADFLPASCLSLFSCNFRC